MRHKIIAVLLTLVISSDLLGAIRNENITDIEVRQLESAVASFSVGQINYIGVVNDQCHCLDGPDCRASVDVTVKTVAKTSLYELAQINEIWQVGPRLQYKFDWAELRQKIRGATEDGDDVLLGRLMEEQKLLALRFYELRKHCRKDR